MVIWSLLVSFLSRTKNCSCFFGLNSGFSKLLKLKAENDFKLDSRFVFFDLLVIKKCFAIFSKWPSSGINVMVLSFIVTKANEINGQVTKGMFTISKKRKSLY